MTPFGDGDCCTDRMVKILRIRYFYDSGDPRFQGWSSWVAVASLGSVAMLKMEKWDLGSPPGIFWTLTAHLAYHYQSLCRSTEPPPSHRRSSGALIMIAHTCSSSSLYASNPPSS